MIKTCEVCSQSFTAKSNHAKYCSDVCRRKAEKLREKKKRQNRPPKVYHKICAVCNKAFETAFYNKKYCSGACLRQAIRTRRRIQSLSIQKPSTLVLPAEEFTGLCSVCGVENVLVEECRSCGFLVCAACRDSAGICNICVHDFVDNNREREIRQFDPTIVGRERAKIG